jgi:hypothetical protein
MAEVALEAALEVAPEVLVGVGFNSRTLSKCPAEQILPGPILQLSPFTCIRIEVVVTFLMPGLLMSFNQ